MQFMILVRASRESEAGILLGPFTETTNASAGFWLIQVQSEAEALEWVKRVPSPAEAESEIEIRQVFGESVDSAASRST